MKTSDKIPNKVFLSSHPIDSISFIGLAYADEQNIVEPVEYINKSAVLNAMKESDSLADAITKIKSL